MRVAVVTRADQPTGAMAARALIDTVDRLYLAAPHPSAADGLASDKVVFVAHEIASGASWDALAAVIGGPVDVLVNGAPDVAGAIALDSDFAAFSARAREALKGPWLGLRTLLPLMSADGAVVNICAGAGEGAWVAEAEGLRLLGQAVVIDAHKTGRALRVNRLLVDLAALDESAVAAAVRALTDARTAFMTGADIDLTDAVGAAA